MENTKSIEIKEPAILIRINQAFRPLMNPEELYNLTRGKWKLNPANAKKAKYGISVYKGIVQEVYEISHWHNASSESGLNVLGSLIGRFEFEGKLAPKEIREKYNQKSVKHYFTKGNSNPINYINL